MKKKIISGAVGVFVLMLTLLCLEVVPNGYVGVVYSPNGGIKDKTLSQGWHLVNPLYSVTEYTIASEHRYYSQDAREGSEGDESFEVATSIGKKVVVDIEFTYRFDESRLVDTFKDYRGRSGRQIEQEFLRSKIKRYLSNVTSKYSILDIYGSKRESINDVLNSYVKNKFKDSGIIISSISIMDVKLDKETASAIQRNVNSKQELERQKIEKAKATIEAEKLTIQAEGRKQVEIIKAQAEAQSLTTKANAIANSNKKIANSLTKELVEYEKIKKWNGQLPKVSGSNALVDIR